MIKKIPSTQFLQRSKAYFCIEKWIAFFNNEKIYTCFTIKSSKNNILCSLENSLLDRKMDHIFPFLEQ